MATRKFSDGTRHVMQADGSARLSPPKPYRNKAERKVWKRRRQEKAGLR